MIIKKPMTDAQLRAVANRDKPSTTPLSNSLNWRTK